LKKKKVTGKTSRIAKKGGNRRAVTSKPKKLSKASSLIKSSNKTRDKRKTKSKKITLSKNSRLSAKKMDVVIDVTLPKLDSITVKTLAGLVCSVLEKNGFDPVLSGRTCAAIYSKDKITIKSLEFVVSEYVTKKIKLIMAKLGFKVFVHRTFSNKHCPYNITFLPPPITVGDSIVNNVHAIKTKYGKLKMLCPTDCVRQRLSVYYRFADKNALKDAIGVAKLRKIDLEFVRKWSSWEWALDKFEIFLSALDI